MVRIDLNGTWECTMPDQRKLQVEVPGCWDTYVDEKDIGEAVNFKKKVYINKEDSQRYFIFFGGVSYYCDIFINAKKVDSHEGMWDEFRVDITDYIKSGDNIIELDITKPSYKNDDRFPLRTVLSGFIPDVLCTFGGIWDDVCIETYHSFYIKSHHAVGNMDGSLVINMILETFYNQVNPIEVSVDIFSPDSEKRSEFKEYLTVQDPGEHKCVLTGRIENPMLWDTEDPNLYTYVVTITHGDQVQTITKSFGFREIRAEGTQIILNGKPVYTRGILHWGYYDDEITPNPSIEAIQGEINDIKAYGFNMIKHCLYIPRKKYFELADKNGILLWVELPLWIPDTSPELVNRIKREYPQILEQIAGYPSVVLLSLGCELDNTIDSSLLEDMYHLAKQKSHALVRDNSGSGECYDGLPIDYADFFDYHFYGDLHNMEHLIETFTPSWRNYRPWLFGEFCDSDTMRDLKLIREEKGLDVLMWEQRDYSKNPVSKLKGDFRADIHDERMNKYGIREEFDLIHKLSINHSMVHRKMTLELTRSFSEICGYNITSIRDVPIATSGMFDDFMRPKFPIAEVKQFNSDIILAPAWDLTRVWINSDRVLYKERFNFFGGDYYGLHVIMSNFSGTVLESPVMKWELLCNDEALLSQSIETDKTFNIGEVKELGYVSTKLPIVTTPQTYVLKVVMESGSKCITNQWPVFVYPPVEKSDKIIGLYDAGNVFTGFESLYTTIKLEDEQIIEGVDIVVTSRLTPKVRDYANQGGKVFYIQRGEGFLPSAKVAFWREGMIRCYDHEVLKNIDYKTWMDDLRFYSLSTDTAFDTSKFKNAGIENVSPIVKRYDCREWIAADYMVDLKMGKGKVVATTLRFEGGMGKQPMFFKKNTFGRWLFNSIMNYFED